MRTNKPENMGQCYKFIRVSNTDLDSPISSSPRGVSPRVAKKRTKPHHVGRISNFNGTYSTRLSVS
jgi:hypothetical protein